MENLDLLRSYGLFDAKVPRYTSYPPANRFEIDTGARNQKKWLSQVPTDKPVSVYIHIPFCRRLCWFCACRTQGTKTLAPIDDYIENLILELRSVSELLPKSRQMCRFHMGGGTPTLLTAGQMDRLLGVVFDVFPAANEFEFSVEIDPTEASIDVLKILQKWGLTRASIGIQDFDPLVQNTIGRVQSFEQTKEIVSVLRSQNLSSINFDLLYGLPHQKTDRIKNTLQKALSLMPDRIALYGYAHVPHVSKRQVMIDAKKLPTPQERYALANIASKTLRQSSYHALGIDHFALKNDRLYQAAQNGNLRRNFQGYTDDTCDTLIGFGASAISKFSTGYVQNAVSTAAYNIRIQEAGLAGHKGYVMQQKDRLIARAIEMLMCDFSIDKRELANIFAPYEQEVEDMTRKLSHNFSAASVNTNTNFTIKTGFTPIARLMAAQIDQINNDEGHHSVAI